MTDIQRVSEDKDFYNSIRNQMIEGKDIFRNSYLVFVGAYYHNEIEDGRKALENIQKFYMEFSNPWQYFNSTLCQAHFYVKEAPSDKVKLHLHSNRFGDVVDDKWRALNPFLLPYSKRKEKDSKDRFYVGIRMTDFDKEGTRYFSAHGGKIKNFYEAQLVNFEDLRKDNKNCVVHKFDGKVPYKQYESNFNVVGFEDYRVALNPDTGKGVAFMVTCDAHGYYDKNEKRDKGIWGPRISMVDLDFTPKNDKPYMTLKNLRPLYSKDNYPVDNNNCQKNWLPFYHRIEGKGSKNERKLYAIYNSCPITIIEINEKSGECTLVKKIEDNNMCEHFRGSSPPVLWKSPNSEEEKYLYTVHIVGFLPNNQGRVYYHRFVEMNMNFEIERVSRLFYLNKSNTVEYVSGGYNDGSYIYLSYGFDDKEAWISRFEYENIEKMFSEGYSC